MNQIHHNQVNLPAVHVQLAISGWAEGRQQSALRTSPPTYFLYPTLTLVDRQVSYHAIPYNDALIGRGVRTAGHLETKPDSGARIISSLE